MSPVQRPRGEASLQEGQAQQAGEFRTLETGLGYHCERLCCAVARTGPKLLVATTQDYPVSRLLVWHSESWGGGEQGADWGAF